MKILQQAFDKVMEENFSPENLTVLLIAKKLKGMGVELTSRQERRLRNQIANLGEDTISIDLKRKQIKGIDKSTIKELTISLEFTEDEADTLIQELTVKIPDLISGVVNEVSSDLYTSLRKQAPRMLRIRRRERYKYSREVRRAWRYPLDLLEQYIVICKEVGAEFNEEVRSDKDSSHSHVIDVLMRLQARACQVSEEIITLLSNGYSDGAHARWRSLHEISSIGYVISKYGEDIAERYLLHDSIETYKAGLEYQKHCKHLGYEPINQAEIDAFKATRDQLKSRYGKEYCEQFGWASHALGKKKPNFAQLEEAAGLEHLRPFYRMASHNVHANPKGVFHKLGLFSWEADLLLTGPSFAGFADPGQGTAISLGQITTALLLIKEPEIDQLVTCEILRHYRDDISSEFARLEMSFEDLEAA